MAADFDQLARCLAESGAGDLSGLFGVRAPLRMCPLGAHLDHQGGRVVGVALDRGLTLAAVPRDEPLVRLASRNFAATVTLRLDREQPAARGDWGDYPRAAAAVLQPAHRLTRGFDAVIAGDFPGAGLSSSAAVLIAYLMALCEVNGISLGGAEIAALTQRAENSYIGLASGLLDPSMILFAQAGQLTHLDCADFSLRHIPLPAEAPGLQILVAFSGVTRALVATGYNERVKECTLAARRLLELAGVTPPAAPRLRDVDAAIFAAEGSRLPPPLRRRAAHFFSEMERVSLGAEAWRRGDVAAFGQLMNASGESSIVNYESGTPPLISLYELLRATEGVLGCRFSGAGFGGSCVALVNEGAGEAAVDALSAAYARAHPELSGEASFDLCRPAGAAALLRREE